MREIKKNAFLTLQFRSALFLVPISVSWAVKNKTLFEVCQNNQYAHKVVFKATSIFLPHSRGVKITLSIVRHRFASFPWAVQSFISKQRTYLLVLLAAKLNKKLDISFKFLRSKAKRYSNDAFTFFFGTMFSCEVLEGSAAKIMPCEHCRVLQLLQTSTCLTFPLRAVLATPLTRDKSYGFQT